MLPCLESTAPWPWAGRLASPAGLLTFLAMAGFGCFRYSAANSYPNPSPTKPRLHFQPWTALALNDYKGLNLDRLEEQKAESSQTGAKGKGAKGVGSRSRRTSCALELIVACTGE